MARGTRTTSHGGVPPAPSSPGAKRCPRSRRTPLRCSHRRGTDGNERLTGMTRSSPDRVARRARGDDRADRPAAVAAPVPRSAAARSLSCSSCSAPVTGSFATTPRIRPTYVRSAADRVTAVGPDRRPVHRRRVREIGVALLLLGPEFTRTARAAAQGQLHRLGRGHGSARARPSARDPQTVRPGPSLAPSSPPSFRD